MQPHLRSEANLGGFFVLVVPVYHPQVKTSFIIIAVRDLLQNSRLPLNMRLCSSVGSIAQWIIILEARHEPFQTSRGLKCQTPATHVIKLPSDDSNSTRASVPLIFTSSTAPWARTTPVCKSTRDTCDGTNISWENNIKFRYKDKSKNNRKETMFLTVGTIFSEINLLFQGKVYRTIKYTAFRHWSFDIVQCMLEWIHARRYQKETSRLTNARRERKHSIKFKWLNCRSNLIFWSALSLELVNDWMARDFHCCSIQGVCSTYDFPRNCQAINKN